MKNKIKFIFHIILHPADGFWDMKREKRGSIPICLALIALQFLTMLINEYNVGFIFDSSVGKTADIGFLLAVAVLPIFLFALANLSITTFLEGEGNFKDIFMMACYALTPSIIIRIITTVLTNVLSLDEQTYIAVLSIISVVWVVLLLFVGIMEVHNYSTPRAVASALLTIVAMAIIIFILLLFLDMVSRIFGFGYSVFQELEMRI
ncbi:MAG: YIP1 family protein [Clostridia bacterium]|nr:YIP1 family protein [Clostridia bacterium]